MEILSGNDAAILALLAMAPDLTTGEQEELISKLLSIETKEIAEALLNRSTNRDAITAAKIFRDWANSLSRNGS